MDKRTKKDYFEILKDLVANADIDENDATELTEFLDKQLDQIENRKVKARERADKKLAESDALTDAIFATVTDDIQSVDEIVLAVDGGEDVTRNRVTSRLGKLARAGKVIKESIKVDGKKRVGYRLPKDGEVPEAE